MRFFILFMLICSVSFADVYVLYNEADKTIMSIDGDDSAVVQSGQKKEIIKGNIEDFDSMTYPDNYYILNGNKVKLNNKKLEEEAQAEEKARKKAEREEKINAKMREIAEADLIAKGEIEAEVK